MTVQVKLDKNGFTQCGNTIEREKTIQLLFSTVYNGGINGYGLGIPNALRNAWQLLSASYRSKKDEFIEASFEPHAYWAVDNRPVGTKQIVDSGCFSLLYGEARGATLKDWEKYAELYIEFINNHFGPRCHTKNTPWFVECDGSPAIGRENYLRIRKKILDSCPNRDFIGVWHNEEGLKTLDELCEVYDYIAISVAVTPKLPAMNAVRYINEKYPEKCIHLLGRSEPFKFRELGVHRLVDTCDSTTWVIPKRFGCNNKRIRANCKPYESFIADKLLRYFPCNYTGNDIRWTPTNIEAESWVLMNVWKMWNEFKMTGPQRQWERGSFREIIRKMVAGDPNFSEDDITEPLYERTHQFIQVGKKVREFYPPVGYELKEDLCKYMVCAM